MLVVQSNTYLYFFLALTAYAIMEGAEALRREMRKENKKNGATANRTGYCERTDCA